MYGYDSYSNRWIEPTGTIPLLILMPTSAGAFDGSTNRFNTSTFGGAYDGAGQMTAQSSVSDPITRADEKWDAAGQRVESKYTYGGVSYTNGMAYDGMGRRVKKLNPWVGDTVFVYDAFGRMAAEYGAGATTACSPCYLFTDMVGSVRLVADETQTVVKRYDTMPFGEQISAGTGWANGRTWAEYTAPFTVKWRFAGSYKDDQSGEWPENVMGARQYNVGYGRFVGPDENLVDQEVGDPLSWNLYGYVRNNPLRYWDPDGRACVWTIDKWEDDNSGGQSCSEVDAETTFKASVSVTDFAPPNALLWAVARGAQSAERPVNALAGTTLAFVSASVGMSAGGAVVNAVAPAFPEALAFIPRTIATFTNKQAARAAIAGMGLTGLQAQEALKSISRATATTTISIIRAGQQLIVSNMRLGRNGYQQVEKFIDQRGGVRIVQKGVTAAGEISHYDIKR